MNNNHINTLLTGKKCLDDLVLSYWGGGDSFEKSLTSAMMSGTQKTV